MISFKNFTKNNINIHYINYLKIDIEGYFPILNEDERNRFETFTSTKRQEEFLATRILKERFFSGKDILYKPEGAPYIYGAPPISISHTKGCSAIAQGTDFSLGLDIEPLGEKALKLHSKFLNEKEIKLLDTTDALLMTRAWSCKEALLKLCNRKGIIFKTDLLILDYDGEETFTCQLNNHGVSSSVIMTTMLHDSLVTTVNFEPAREK